MPYYHICPHCGSSLDPGERCSDCIDDRKTAPVLEHRSGSASKVLEHQNGQKVNVIDQTTFASHFTE